MNGGEEKGKEIGRKIKGERGGGGRSSDGFGRYDSDAGQRKQRKHGGLCSESEADRDVVGVPIRLRLSKMAALVSVGVGSLVGRRIFDIVWIDGEGGGVRD
ncbi:hypothetical protein F0562_010186 [Nyssa sinensis]|uniref:Uncharacterized protein n=1 Tax=Nyssa sinensis TaxID=561372 RepID=A0A5J4ZY51_9ASTE|nr:hypothetical protein F0562_010186 [Nyssa sinensis]